MIRNHLRTNLRRILGRNFRMACVPSTETYSTSSSDEESVCSSEQTTELPRRKFITPEERQEMLSNLRTMSFGGVAFDQLSKNSQKKILQIRLKRKLQKRKKKELGGSSSSSSSLQPTEGEKVSKKILKQQQTSRLREALKNGLRVAIDCSMGGQMSAKEVCKLGRQINRVYSLVRSSEKPFHLYLTGLVKDSAIHKECERQCDGFSNYLLDTSESMHHELFPHNELVYLTPDSPSTLESLDQSKVYVLGGLVDESLDTGLTYRNAQMLKIDTARLPIDVYMDKTVSDAHCCLPINLVVAILLDIHSGSTWSAALENSIPSRKGYILKPSCKKK